MGWEETLHYGLHGRSRLSFLGEEACTARHRVCRTASHRNACDSWLHLGADRCSRCSLDCGIASQPSADLAAFPAARCAHAARRRPRRVAAQQPHRPAGATPVFGASASGEYTSAVAASRACGDSHRRPTGFLAVSDSRGFVYAGQCPYGFSVRGECGGGSNLPNLGRDAALGGKG